MKSITGGNNKQTIPTSRSVRYHLVGRGLGETTGTAAMPQQGVNPSIPQPSKEKNTVGGGNPTKEQPPIEEINRA